MAEQAVDGLYTSFKDDARGWLSLYRQHFSQFVTIILAILAVSVTALHNLRDQTLLLVLVALGPTLNVVLGVLAIRVCRKYYLRYWEHEAVSYKLFDLMDKDHQINKRLAEGKGLFPQDQHLFPGRWIKRASKYATAEEFAAARVTAPGSSNYYIRITFWVLIGISTIVGLAMIGRAIANFWLMSQP